MNEPNYARPPKVAFTVFGLDIRFYAIMILIGVLLAIVVVSFLFKRRNIPVGWVIDLLLCVLPLGIIGARTFSVLTERGSSIADWFNFQGGGLSITGGIIGGALGVVLFCLIHKINFLRVADCLVPGLILAQAIGRWGNFFNQEVYGGKVTDPALQWFPFAVYIDDVGEWHYAFFFYEMLANLLIFALLFTLMWKCNKRPSGLSMAGYFFGYGLVRSIMEPLRDPQFQLGHTVMISEVFAILMCVGGFLLAAVLIGWNKYKHGSFFGSKNSEPLAVLPVYYTREQRKAMEEERKKTAARILRDEGVLDLSVSIDGVEVTQGKPTVTFNNSYDPLSVTTNTDPTDAGFSGTKTVTNEHGEYELKANDFTVQYAGFAGTGSLRQNICLYPYGTSE